MKTDVNPDIALAYVWKRIAQNYGCSATYSESDFDAYKELDRDLAETLADEILVSIKDNIRDLQK